MGLGSEAYLQQNPQTGSQWGLLFSKTSNEKSEDVKNQQKIFQFLLSHTRHAPQDENKSPAAAEPLQSTQHDKLKPPGHLKEYPGCVEATVPTLHRAKGTYDSTDLNKHDALVPW